MDPADRHVLIEQQRAETIGLLRRAESAVVIAVDENGQMVTSYFNLNPIERRGLIELMSDTAPRFYPVSEDEDDDEG